MTFTLPRQPIWAPEPLNQSGDLTYSTPQALAVQPRSRHVSGKIALINRGGCSFDEKGTNAQDRGRDWRIDRKQ
ncbi:MAG: hypothetical protein IPJ46_18735 [Anaerolineales bacterium]|nr:hypothetical protein [Anaerolineales bacterium]